MLSISYGGMGYPHQVGPVAGAPIDPPHLPWSVYVYGPDGFACKHAMGSNTNLLGSKTLGTNVLELQFVSCWQNIESRFRLAQSMFICKIGIK